MVTLTHFSPPLRNWEQSGWFKCFNTYLTTCNLFNDFICADISTGLDRYAHNGENENENPDEDSESDES